MRLVISPTTGFAGDLFLNPADAEVARGSEGLNFDAWCDWRPVRMLSPSLGCLHAGATIGLSVSTLAAVGLPGDLIRRRRRSKAASEPGPSRAKPCPPGTTRMTRRCSGRSTPSTPRPPHPRAHPRVRPVRAGHERPARTAGARSRLRAGLVTTFYTYLEPTPRKATPGGNQVDYKIVAGCEAVRTNVAEIIARALDKLAKLR
jgi:hypothetical protein